MTDVLTGIVVAILSVVTCVAVSRHFFLWLQAYLTGTRISLLSLIMMSLRKVDPAEIVRCKIMAVQAGLQSFSTDALESQYLAGGSVERVTAALVIANRAGIFLNWDTAAAVDLAGRDVLEAVRLSVNPRVIMCPDPSAGRGDTLGGVAKDGIQLKVRVCVTVRTNLSQLVGGATESTVIARVGQGIVSAIGSCDSYRDALGDPMVITRNVLAKSLDSQTAFAIVSIDIADITVGANIGARLQIDQAEADIRIARAHAEERRAMAFAREQEMVALTRENEANVALAEADIPVAVATAFRRGQLRVRDQSRRIQAVGQSERQSIGNRTQELTLPPDSSGSNSTQAWETEGGACEVRR
ncbi:MAG: flotillin-like protein FloA [Planctomycetaceae bacterium]